MKLNQTNVYAIAAMIHVAKLPPGDLARGQEIADSAKMPARYLFQVLTKLDTAGLLIGARGTTGGDKLARPAQKITLLDIIEAVDGPIGPDKRVVMPAISRKAMASVNGAFAAIEADARKRLAAVTLSSLRAAKAA